MPRNTRPTRPTSPTRTGATARPSRRRSRRALKLGALDRRVRWGLTVMTVLLVVIGGRLVELQAIDHSGLAGAAAAQRVATVELNALRGRILDRNGVALAYTSNAQDITADPTQVPAAEGEHYAQVLSPLLGVKPAKIVRELDGTSQYAMLAQALSPAIADKVTGLGLPGIYTQATTQRQYPGSTTGANVIGTVHEDGQGAAGIEQQYNSVLAGRNGSITYSVDNLGNVNPASTPQTTPAVNGSTVRLTIDDNLQYMIQRYLKSAVAESGAENAEVAVLDAHTGQVLSLASTGTFDAANPNTINPNEPIDPPVMSVFEPGSVQKAITFAAALQQGLIKPQTHIRVPGKIRMGGVTISDAWAHTTQTFTATGVLAESSNVGTLKIAHMMGRRTWFHYEKLFGVGEKTGIELPGESSGYLPPLRTWSASTFANLPFGQGEDMTILQLASIYQAIANNGVRIPPRIVQSVTSPDGAVHATKQPAGIKVIDPSTDKTLRTMLESVILPGGTGVKAAVPGYIVAGKTGTAQQPDSSGGAYSSWKNWDTFAGMVPADNPQFVVAIMVNNPAQGLEGGDVAAPLYNKIASYELQHAGIAPTGAKAKHVPLEDCKTQNPIYLPPDVC